MHFLVIVEWTINGTQKQENKSNTADRAENPNAAFLGSALNYRGAAPPLPLLPVHSLAKWPAFSPQTRLDSNWPCLSGLYLWNGRGERSKLKIRKKHQIAVALLLQRTLWLNFNHKGFHCENLPIFFRHSLSDDKNLLITPFPTATPLA